MKTYLLMIWMYLMGALLGYSIGREAEWNSCKAMLDDAFALCERWRVLCKSILDAAEEVPDDGQDR